MTRQLLRIAGIVAMLQLGACASLHALRPDVTAQVDQWVSEHEYSKAIATIEEVGPQREQYAQLQARLPEIRRRAQRYETTLVQEALRLAGDQRWQESLDMIDLGLQRVPDGERLRAARQEILAERDEYLETLETRLLISRAEQLIHDLPVHAEVAEIIPRDRAAISALERAQRDATVVAQQLLSSAKQAHEQQESFLALRCLRLSVALAPTEEATAMLAEVEEAAREREGAARAARKQRVVRVKAAQRDALIAAYKTAFENGDLAQARLDLAAATNLAPADREILSLESQLQLAIDERVAEGIEQGRRRYILGDIQGALETWMPLLELDPRNKKLQEHIDRAKRVLRNLKELEEREPTIQVPG